MTDILSALSSAMVPAWPPVELASVTIEALSKAGLEGWGLYLGLGAE